MYRRDTALPYIPLEKEANNRILTRMEERTQSIKLRRLRRVAQAL